LDIVLQYPGLENRVSAEAALRELRALEWVTNSDSESPALTMQSPELRELIGKRLQDPEVPGQLGALRAKLHPNAAHVLGPMTEAPVYSTYLDLLRGAQDEICLPMLVTTAQLFSVDILRERAMAGVRIKILVGAPSVVGLD